MSGERPRRRDGRVGARGPASWAAAVLLAVAVLVAPVAAAVAGTMAASASAPTSAAASATVDARHDHPPHGRPDDDPHVGPHRGGGDGGFPTDEHTHADACSWCLLGRWSLPPAVIGIAVPPSRAAVAGAPAPSIEPRAAPRTDRSRAPPVAA